MEFSKWLQVQLKKRKLSQADLARKSGLSSATISLILTDSRGVGPKSCLAIAKALDIPYEEVFQAADLISPKPIKEIQSERLSYYLDQLDEPDRDEVIAFAELKVRLASQRNWAAELQSRLSAVPPDQQSQALQVIIDYLAASGIAVTKRK